MTLFNRLPSLFPANVFEKDFNDIFSGFEKLNRMNFAYPYDIYDLIKDKERIATVIEIAAAGFKKEDCKISIKGDQLTLKLGNKTPTEELVGDDKNIDGEGITRQYVSKRIANRTAQISWTLYKDVDQKNIKVKYTDGILKITLPIKQPEKPEENFIEIQ